VVLITPFLFIYNINMKNLTTQEFIDKSIKIHNDKYDYSKVIYINTRTKVEIICKIHGSFYQKPNNHSSGFGCNICSNNNKKSKEKFIIESNKIHNNRYDYSKVIHINNHTNVDIICNRHGEFAQTPKKHLNGNGCPKCAYKNLSIEEIKEEFNKIHHNRYDYSKFLSYENHIDKILIICNKHGEFEQSITKHKQGHGCCKCNNSKSEIIIENYLKDKNIEYINQKKFDDCKNINKLPFDFYLPKYNICIEYDGRQHFNSIDIFGGDDYLTKIIKNDKIKNEYCLKNNIHLIRIRYDENIFEKLNSTFNI